MVAPQPRKGRTPTCALPRAIAAPFFPFPCTEAVFQGRWVGCFPGGTGPCPLHCAIPREGQPLPPPTAIIIFISLSLSETSAFFSGVGWDACRQPGMDLQRGKELSEGGKCWFVGDPPPLPNCRSFLPFKAVMGNLSRSGQS